MVSWAFQMRVFHRFILGAALLSGCAGRIPEPPSPTMVRSFQGTLVPGYYVSPAAYQHYIEAQLLSNEGRAEEAAEELRHALASDGASAYLRTRLAEELLALGRVDEAREEVEAALHLDPEFPEAFVDLARVRLRLSDQGGAESALHHALELDRSCEDAYIALAGLYHDRGQDARVEQMWQQLAREVPSSVSAHYALGRAAASHDDEKGAEQHWKKALELDPGLQDARLGLAQLYQGQGRTAEAAALYGEAYERSGDLKIAEMLVKLDMAQGRERQARELCDRLDDEGGVPERRLLIGWLRLTARQQPRALAIADDLLQKGESPAARLLAGAALDEQGRADEALAQLRKVPVSAGEYAASQERIGRLLRDSGRYREATELLTRAIAQVNGDSLQQLLAEVHERAGDSAAGIHVLEAALQKRPLSASLALALGGAYQRAGQWQKAVELIEKGLLQRDPESAAALNFVGYALAEHNVKLDEAKKMLERALALKPSSGEIADSLGWLFVKLGRLDQAERLLLRADRLAPEEPEILQHLGELYVKKADRGRALDAYKRALRNKPEERLRHLCEQQILLLETGRLGSR
jgi:tetratricopeptide (TPR) repeat protein